MAQWSSPFDRPGPGLILCVCAGAHSPVCASVENKTTSGVIPQISFTLFLIQGPSLT